LHHKGGLPEVQTLINAVTALPRYHHEKAAWLWELAWRAHDERTSSHLI